jgi:hypothetical protein
LLMQLSCLFHIQHLVDELHGSESIGGVLIVSSIPDLVLLAECRPCRQIPTRGTLPWCHD